MKVISFLQVLLAKAGHKLFQLTSPDHVDSYRSFYSPTLPWQIKRPKITCFDSLGVHYLDAGAGHPSYQLRTGDSTRIIPVKVPGEYSVFKPYGDGAFISSEKQKVANLNTACISILPDKKVVKRKAKSNEMNRIYLLLLFMSSFRCFAEGSEFKITVYDSSATHGYFFLSNPDRLMILDKYGELVYYRLRAAGCSIYNFALQPNGLMSYSDLTRFYLMDSTFRKVDSIEGNERFIMDKHELQVLSNGHFLLLGLDSMREDGTIKNANNIATDTDGTVIPKWTVVLELDRNKNIVFEWHAKDHFKKEEIDSYFLVRGPVISWNHSNAAEMDHDGNILLSNRNMDEITKINRTDGSVMWRLGGIANQFRVINCPVPFYGQHDIRRIKNGHITLFDNGNHSTHHGARALEFKLDEKNKTAELIWSYMIDSNIYSTRSGNMQRLSNSNTLINYGTLGRNPENHLSFVVVNKQQEKVVQMNGATSYRVFNYASLPWQLNRPQISCFDSLGVLYLQAEAGHSSYRWNTGDSTEKIPARVAGIFSVFVPYGDSGYISSEQFSVSIRGTDGHLSGASTSGSVKRKPKK